MEHLFIILFLHEHEEHFFGTWKKIDSNVCTGLTPSRNKMLPNKIVGLVLARIASVGMILEGERILNVCS